MTALIFLVLRILLSITLYGFLFFLFYILWKDIRQQGSLLAFRKHPLLSLSIKTPGSDIQTRHFEADEILIGRDPTCDCYLEDENVSSRHSLLKYHHSQWWLKDLGSTNGTYLNNLPVNSSVVIISADEITCGKHNLVVSIMGDLFHSPSEPVLNRDSNDQEEDKNA